jgi:hypothetical protein
VISPALFLGERKESQTAQVNAELAIKNNGFDIALPYTFDPGGI